MGNEQSQELQLRGSSIMTKLLLKSQEEVIKHLAQEQIELNRSINQVNINLKRQRQMGDKISHYAAYKSMYRLLQWLIWNDAQFEKTQNHRKLTPLDVAAPQTRQWLYRKIGEYQIQKYNQMLKMQQQALKSQKTQLQAQKNSVQHLPLKSKSQQNQQQAQKNAHNESRNVFNHMEQEKKQTFDFASLLGVRK